MLLSRLRSLARNVLRRDRIERDLDDEVHAMLDVLIGEHRRKGLPEQEARRAALLQLGGVQSVKEQVREVRAGALLETLLKDIHYAARLLVRNPLFAATAILSISIGVGATTAVFTVANGLLLSVPPGVFEPENVVEIAREEPGNFGVKPIVYPDYLALRERSRSFAGIYGYALDLESLSLRADDTTERVFGGFITMNFFTVLGVHPEAGRLFGVGDDERPGMAPIVVLSHSYWTRRFRRDPAIVGRTVLLNGQPMTVAGVASADFRGMSLVVPDVWVPAVMIASLDPGKRLDFSPASQLAWQMMMGGRLNAGVSRGEASAEVSALGAAIERDHEQRNAFLRATGIPQPDGPLRWYATRASLIPAGLRLPAAAFLSLLMVLVAVVLVIACANLAGVLLARATVRRREIAVRAAIGAARRRLVGQLLTETAVLFVVACGSGLLLARGLTTVLVRLLPEFPLPINLSLPLDSRAVLFSLAISLVAAVLSGLAPAIHGSRADVTSVLKDESQGSHDRLRLRNAFVVAQVALSILLVVVAGLLVRVLHSISAEDRGYDSRGVDIATVDLSMAGYTSASGANFTRELLDRVRALPGVESATLADRAPGAGGLSLGGLTVPGVTPPHGRPFFFANWNLVESGYFRTLGIPLVAGRDFDSGDHASAQQVAIVGEGTAERLWPGKSAVGQTLFVSTPREGAAPAPVPLIVVGVVRDVRVDGFRGVAPLLLYVPFQQRYVSSVTVLARGAGARRSAGDLRALITGLDPNLPVLAAEGLENQQTGPKQTILRVAASVSGGVGLVGLLLAAIGIYGVTAYAVTRRTRELGVRLALGATRATVVGMVLRQGMTLVAIGSTIGLLCGVFAAVALSNTIGASPDAVVFAGAALLFAAVGFVACYLPVRRAMRIGAMEALRYE